MLEAENLKSQQALTEIQLARCHPTWAFEQLSPQQCQQIHFDNMEMFQTAADQRLSFRPMSGIGNGLCYERRSRIDAIAVTGRASILKQVQIAFHVTSIATTRSKNIFDRSLFICDVLVYRQSKS